MSDTTTDTTRGTAGAWRLVARREIAVKLGDRTFLAGSAFMVVLIAALIGIQVWVESGSDTYEVAVTSETAEEMAGAVADRAPDLEESVEIDVVTLDSADAAEAAVDDEDVDAWLRAADDGSWTLVTRETPDAGLRRVVTDAVRDEALARNASAAGTSMAQLGEGADVELEQRDGEEQLGLLRDILGFAFAFLFYVASLMFGMTLASSVVEEKQSRIVEIIAAAVPLRQLLAGKVVGNAALAVVQMTAYVAVGLVGLSFTELGDLVPAFTGEVVWFLAFFVVGFLALSCLWAVAGALASRNEDLQSTATPVTMLLLAVFLGSAFAEGRWEVVASYVPPFSAVAMPVRLISGSAGWWEAVVSLLLLAAFAGLLVLVAERIYRRALMQTGGRLTMRQAWRLEE